MLDFSKKHSQNIGRIEILNLQSNHTLEKGYVSRIFNRKFFHFEGSVHEQLVSASQINRSMVDLDVSIIHYGYANEDVNQKKARIYRKMIKKSSKKLLMTVIFYINSAEHTIFKRTSSTLLKPI